MASGNDNTTDAPVREVMSKWLDAMKTEANDDLEALFEAVTGMTDRSHDRARLIMKYRDALGRCTIDEADLTERVGVLHQKCDELTHLFDGVRDLLRANDFEDVNDVFEEDKKAAKKALKGGLKYAKKAAADHEAAEKVVQGLEKGMKRAVRDVPPEAENKWVRLL